MVDGFSKVVRFALRALIVAYQLLLRPVIGPRCRYLPSCSQYGLEAIERHGALGGIGLTVSRLARCHPWGASGLDPVPEQLRCNRCNALSHERAPGLFARSCRSPMARGPYSESDQHPSA